MADQKKILVAYETCRLGALLCKAILYDDVGDFVGVKTIIQEGK